MICQDKEKKSDFWKCIYATYQDHDIKEVVESYNNLFGEYSYGKYHYMIVHPNWEWNSVADTDNDSPSMAEINNKLSVCVKDMSTDSDNTPEDVVEMLKPLYMKTWFIILASITLIGGGYFAYKKLK